MQGWVQVKRELESTFRAVTQLGYAVLFISHDKDKTFKRQDGTALTLRSLDGTVDCGSRFRYMQPEISFSYNSLVDALNQSIDREAEYAGKEFITNERNTSTSYEELDFDALYKECSEMLKSIPPEKKEYYRPRIKEIVGRNLGKGKKISQITRNQVEQLSLIVYDLRELFEEEVKE